MQCFEQRLPLVVAIGDVVEAQVLADVALGVQVDDQDAVARRRGLPGDVRCRTGLAGAPLAIQRRDSSGPHRVPPSWGEVTQVTRVTFLWADYCVPTGRSLVTATGVSRLTGTC